MLPPLHSNNKLLLNKGLSIRYHRKTYNNHRSLLRFSKAFHHSKDLFTNHHSNPNHQDNHRTQTTPAIRYKTYSCKIISFPVF